MSLFRTRRSRRSGSATVYEGPLYAASTRRFDRYLTYLDEHSPHGARNVKRAINKAVTLIGQHSKIGRFSNVEETRVFPVGRYPYLIYWSIEAGDVWIVHIRHARRRPWADELSDQSD